VYDVEILIYPMFANAPVTLHGEVAKKNWSDVRTWAREIAGEEVWIRDGDRHAYAVVEACDTYSDRPEAVQVHTHEYTVDTTGISRSGRQVANYNAAIIRTQDGSTTIIVTEGEKLHRLTLDWNEMYSSASWDGRISPTARTYDGSTMRMYLQERSRKMTEGEKAALEQQYLDQQRRDVVARVK
jgi:hypothetical protein